MNYGTLAAFHPDSYMARRGSTRQGFGGEYHRPELSVPNEFLSSATPISEKLLTHSSSQFISSPIEQLNLVLNGISSSGSFPSTPVGYDIPEQSMIFATPHTPIQQNVQMNIEESPYTVPHFLEPMEFHCRAREDREIQLDTRCLRIIRRLNGYTEYRGIARRFVKKEITSETMATTGSYVNKTRLRSPCGVRSHLLRVLRLKEPQQYISRPDQTSPYYPGDSASERRCLREVNESPSRHEVKRTSRESNAFEHPYELEDTWILDRPVTNTPLGDPASPTPETLLRRLARSISTRLVYKKNLLEQATNRVSVLEKDTDMVRLILLKVSQVLPQMRSEVDVCYFYIPPTSSLSPQPTVEIKICQIASTYSLPPGHRVTMQNATANLLGRFGRLISSQTALLELLCQLTRRVYSVELRIETVHAKTSDYADQPTELEDNLSSLRSRRQQLEDQIVEAQGLQDDLENTKTRLLTGLQYQFYVFQETPFNLAEIKSSEVSSSLLDDHDCNNSSGHSSPARSPHSQVDSVMCLAEFVSQHIFELLQALIIKLSLETEISDDQEVIDSIGEHLRLVASFSP